MTIQDLGSLGEFMAAIATLVTLVYLALQLRNNTRVNRFDAHMKARQLTSEALKVQTEPDKARLFRIGLSDPSSLTDDERSSFHAMLYLIVNSVDARHEYRRATRDPDAYENVGDALEDLSCHPGFRLWWEHASRNYSADMSARVARYIRENRSEPRPFI